MRLRRRSLQDGTQHDEAVFGAKVGEDGSIVLFGGTAGHWGDTHEGSADIVVAKLHSNGSLLWGWQVMLAMEARNA